MQRKFLATVLRNGFFLKAALYSVLLMAMIVGFTGCDDGTSDRTGNSILGITLEKANGDAVWIGDDLDINEERANVTLSVRPGEDVTALIPILRLSPGATVVPEPPAAPVDLTLPKTFQIAAENGSVRPWVVRVKELNAEKSITGVTLYDSNDNVIVKEAIEIDADKKQVLITVPKGTDLTAIKAIPDLSPGAKLIPDTPAEEEEEEEDTGYDFTQALKLTIEAQDGTPQVWTVNIKEVEKSGQNDITGVSLKDAAGATIWKEAIVIDPESKQVFIEVAIGTDLTAIKAYLELSPDAAPINPPAEGYDFTQPREFTVTAENGTPQVWTVAIKEAKKNGQNDITGVTLKDAAGATIWKEAIEIDPESKQIFITVPKGTGLTGIAAYLDLSPGAAPIDPPAEGYDFTQPLEFTVTAEDGTQQVWTVAIKKNGENDITGISLVKSGANSEDDSSIHILSGSLDTDTKEIVLTVPWNTDLSAVTAVLALSTDAKLPAGSPGDDGLWSVENLDLTRTQYFTVEAQDGSKQTWTVKAEYDTSYIIALDVELAGAYKVKFGFSYPNHKEIGGEPDYTGYDYDIAYKNGGSLDTANPIRLSYFVTDNAIYEGSARKTYYNTLVVSAPGFTDVEWRIDGRAAPGNNSTPGGPLSYVYVGQNNGDWSYVTGSGYINTPGTGEFDRVPSFNSPNSNILTIRAQDWFLESTHTVVFIGKRDNILYSGTFEFKVVEQEPKKEAGE